jgi:hypothetical protein
MGIKTGLPVFQLVLTASAGRPSKLMEKDFPSENLFPSI